MGYRIIYFLVLVVIGLFVTPIISLPLAIIYALRWYALELIILGWVFDTYFGNIADWPYYTLALFALVFIAEVAKRYLMVRT